MKYNNLLKKIYMIVILIIALSIAAGCGKAEGADTELEESSNAEAASAVSGQPEHESEYAGETNPNTDHPISHGTLTTSEILMNKEAADENGILWYIPNEVIESGMYRKIGLYQGNLLIVDTDVVGRTSIMDERVISLQLVSREDGQVLKQAEFTGLEMAEVQICEDKIALIDWSAGKIILVDEELQAAGQYTVSADSSALYLNPAGTKAYAFTWEEGIRVTDLADGEEKMLLENAASLSVSNRCKDVVTFSYTDRDTQRNVYGMIDLASEEMEIAPFDGFLYDMEYVDGIWLSAGGREGAYYLGQNDQVSLLYSEEGSSNLNLLADTGHLMALFYDESGCLQMALYSRDGSLLSGCRMGEDIYVLEEPIWSEADGGYFLLAVDPSGGDRLLFWDLTVPGNGQNLLVEAVSAEDAPEGTAVSQELYDRAADLGEKYGVKIRIADRTDLDYGDYLIEQECSEMYIETALDGVERVLSAYPDGFLEQLYYGDIGEVEIHLAGMLHKLDIPDGEVNGFTSFDGFAQEQSGKAVVVVDITRGIAMEQTLHHELFHLVDNKLSFDAGIRRESAYSEEAWMELNPDGFDYAWDTSVLPEEIFQEEYDYWFVDIYSRTFPREDRARIMEYALIGEEGMFVSASYRQAKLQYLCDCIRDAFDTTGWPEMTVWEDTLERSRSGF